jgi:hypothetical protein
MIFTRLSDSRKFHHWLFCYYLQRAQTLHVSEFPILGRIRNSRLRMKDASFNSRYALSPGDLIYGVHGLLSDQKCHAFCEYNIHTYTLQVCASENLLYRVFYATKTDIGFCCCSWLKHRAYLFSGNTAQEKAKK